VPPRSKWLLLAYRIPREPSTPRIALWRKLRQLGAAQIVDGLVALPATAETREQFDWLAQSVRESAGDAWVWESELRSAAQERELMRAMADAIANEYREVAAAARRARCESAVPRRRTVARLRRELHRIDAHNYDRSPERAAAVDAIDRLAAKLEPAR
jgi:hypothetical protein